MNSSFLTLFVITIITTKLAFCEDAVDVDEFAFPTIKDIDNKKYLMASFNCGHSTKHANLVNKLSDFLKIDQFETCAELDAYKKYMCSKTVHEYKFVVLDGMVKRPVILNLYRDGVAPVILNFSGETGVCDDFYITVKEGDDLRKLAGFVKVLSEDPKRFLRFIKEKYENCERNLLLTKLCGMDY